MKHSILGTLALLILCIAAGSAHAQSEPTRDDPPRRVMPPEQWDAGADRGIDWDEANPSALEDTTFFRPPRKRPWVAAAEILGMNAGIWFYDRYIREGGSNPGFRIGWASWGENLANGWEWDDNSFNTNQFAHPYHGSMYFNAARANGFSFWESVPFTFAGSWTWEYLFEVHHPSMNDWIATSVGGVTLGEMLHRLALTVRDNTAHGGERNWREVGGLLVDPMGGFNRIINGDWGRVQANPPDRFPRNYRSQLDVGFRTVADDKLWSSTDTTKIYARYHFDYGDMFFGDFEKPFDHFVFDLHLLFDDVSLIGRAEVDGLLGGVFLKETEPASHIFATYVKFDYLNTYRIEYGGQSFGAGIDSRFATPSGMEMRTELHANVIVLGADTSDYRSISGRSYDYGPGLGFDLKARLGRDGWNYLSLRHSQHWIHTVNGTDSDHLLTESVVRLDLPVKYNIGLGLEYRLITAERRYADYEDVSRRSPELRLTTTWLLH